MGSVTPDHYLSGVGELELDDGPRFEVVYNLALRQREQRASGGQGAVRPVSSDDLPEADFLDAVGQSATLRLRDSRRVRLVVKSARPPGRILVVNVEGPIVGSPRESE